MAVRHATVERIAEAVTHYGLNRVALDGRAGSGKTTLAGLIADHLAMNGPAAVVHGDDFFRPMPPARRLAAAAAQGYRQYFDWERLRDQVLVPLAAGRPARYARPPTSLKRT